MHVESDQAIYTERDSKVVLFPSSKFTRDTLHMEGGRSDVQLDKGAIRFAKMAMARGVHDDPGRKVEYAADELDMNFDDGMVIRTIEGHDHAQLISTSDTARTTVNSDRLDMDFETTNKESTLKTAVATGKSVVQAIPIQRAGTQPKDQTSDTRILHSDVIHLAMKPGGKEIDRVETDGPGKLEFLPTQPDQPKRSMQGDRIWVAYGKENRIQRDGAPGTNHQLPVRRGRPARPRRQSHARPVQGSDDAGRLGANLGSHRLGERRPHRDEPEIGRLHGRRPCVIHSSAGPQGSFLRHALE
jgi:hypothetical protein